MKKRILCVLLAICLMLPLATVGFAAVRYFDSVSINVNIMEETGIDRANSQLFVYAYTGSTSYSDSIISDRHWYIALTEIEAGKTADDYIYDAANSLYLKEMTADDIFEKGNTYAVRFSARAYSSETQFAPESAESVKINGNAINSEGYNGTYTLQDFDVGSSILANNIITVYTLLPASSVKDRVYDVTVAGTAITKDNKNDVLGNGTVRYVPASGGERAKLYLQGAYKSAQYSTSQITASEDLDIYVSGTNRFESTNNSAFTVATSGISVNGSLGIYGDGSLWVNARASTKTCDGIICTGDLCIGGNVSVTSTAIQGSTHTYGISAGGDITVAENAVVKVNTAREPGNAYNAYGIRGNNVNILDNADVYAENGLACKNANYGIYAANTLTFSGKILRANRYGTSGYALYSAKQSFVNVVCYGTNSGTTASSINTEISINSLSGYNAVRIEKAFPISVNDKTITASGKDDVLGDGTVQYIPAEANKPAQLILDGAALNRISANEDIVIDVISDSAIDSSASTSETSLFVKGKCHLKGSCLRVKGGSAAIGIRVTDFFNLGLDELTVDAKTALSAPFIPKSNDEVYVDSTYCSEDPSVWDGTTPISSYSHIYIVSYTPSLRVNGITVTEENQNDYYEAEHWYAEMPGIDSVDMVLHLEGVNFTAGGEDAYGTYGTVAANGDLTLELSGENIVTCPGSTANSVNAAVFCSGNLTVNGENQDEDILHISSTLSNTSTRMENYALFVQGDLTLNNCKVFAYAPNCYSSYSYGVSAFGALNVNHAYIEAQSRNGADDSEFSSIGIEAYLLNIDGHDSFVSGISYADSGYGVRLSGCREDVSLTEGTFIAGGMTAAYRFGSKKLVIDDYIEPLVYTSTERLYSSTEWDGTTPFSDCKYVKVIQGAYDIGVGGVEVTPVNASDILGDGTAVLTFDENACPVLTLTDANIAAFSKANSPLYNACIWSVKPLTVIFNGNCTVDCGSGVINSVAENRRYAVFNKDNNITVIVNDGSTVNLGGYRSLYSGGDINIKLNGNAVLNCDGLESTSANIGCYNFSLTGDGGYTFNVVNPGAGSCIALNTKGCASFVSDSTEVFSQVNLRHYCPDFPETASAVLATMKPLLVNNVFLTIRGFLPTTTVIPTIISDAISDSSENILITAAKDAGAAFSCKWYGTEPFVNRETGECYDFLKVEPYYDTYDYADVNGDEVIDGNDYAEIVNKALSTESDFPHKTAYDLNRDTYIDVLDCVLSERLSNGHSVL